MTRNCQRTFILAAFILFRCAAGATTLVAIGQGWCNNTPYCNGGPTAFNNYASDDMGTQHFNNFFTFDLSGVNGTITSATLNLWNPSGPVGPGMYGGDGTFTVYNATADLAALASGPYTISVYNGLTAGGSIGSVTVAAGSNGQYITVTLAGNGITALNSAIGQEFLVGGSFSNGGGGLFGYTGYGADVLQPNFLQIATIPSVPEPQSWLLFAGGLTIMTALLCKRFCSH